MMVIAYKAAAGSWLSVAATQHVIQVFPVVTHANCSFCGLQTDTDTAVLSSNESAVFFPSSVPRPQQRRSPGKAVSWGEVRAGNSCADKRTLQHCDQGETSPAVNQQLADQVLKGHV